MIETLLRSTICLCAHNPRRDVLQRALAALAAQSLDRAQWELVVVDNRSNPPLREWLDLSGLSNARLVEQPTLGLTHARLRAIEAARSPMLVFVDDDNLLAPDYLRIALEIMDAKPFLGAIGGRCVGEFEVPPPRWSRRFLRYLAVADHGPDPIWARHPRAFEPWYPCGAGLVIRRAAAEEYARQLLRDPRRTQYDRRGAQLSSAGDIDMLFTALDAGLALGYFPRLSLTHVIPAQRLKPGYLARMLYHAHLSSGRLFLARGIANRPRPWPLACFASLAQCLLERDWHPLTCWIALQGARGRYAALRDQRSAPPVEAGAASPPAGQTSAKPSHHA